MGSTGSGSFSDYSKRKPSNDNAKDGGASGKDQCGQAFSDSLEDISRCFYYLNTSDVPPVGTDIKVFFNGIRIAVETELGEEIGYLPTKYNYLRFCMSDGFNYVGVIKNSSLAPSPSVYVDIVPV